MSKKHSIGTLPPILDISETNSPRPRFPRFDSYLPATDRPIHSPFTYKPSRKSRASRASGEFFNESLQMKRKKIILPDFYMGNSFKKGKSEYKFDNVFEDYEKKVRFMNEIESKEISLSKETYFTSFEIEMINSLKLAQNEKKKDPIMGT